MIYFLHSKYGKGKGKGHPITGHEGPEGETRYSPTISFGARWGSVVNATPRPAPIVQEAG